MSNSLTIESYQGIVNKWIKEIGGGYFQPTTNVCMLAEEVGEVSRLISRTYGEQKFKAGETPENFKEALADELVGVFFVLTCIANEQGIDLEESIVRNMDKKYSRDKKRYISDSRA